MKKKEWLPIVIGLVVLVILAVGCLLLKQYNSMEDMEEIINKKFMNTDEITINWEWKYYINEIEDIADTRDGEIAQKYIFEIIAVVEELERVEI